MRIGKNCSASEGTLRLLPNDMATNLVCMPGYNFVIPSIDPRLSGANCEYSAVVPDVSLKQGFKDDLLASYPDTDPRVESVVLLGRGISHKHAFNSCSFPSSTRGISFSSAISVHADSTVPSGYPEKVCLFATAAIAGIFREIKAKCKDHSVGSESFHNFDPQDVHKLPDYMQEEG